MLSTNHRYFFLAFIVLSSLLMQSCDDGTPPPPMEKEVAPDFSLKLFDGSTFQLSDMKGKAVVINFFASWCVSCGEETPTIDKIAQEYTKKGVVFLAIAIDDTEKKARAFINKVGLNIPAGLDKTGEIKEAYGLYGMPTTFFIDKQGMVSYFHAGVVTAKLLEHEIEKLL